MAPELFSGGAASTQTDVYSVGVLLFRLVTGSFPLPARSLAEVRLGHEQNRAKRLRDERSDLPSAFVSIVERALSRDPARRYASAGELELALTGFLATSAELSTGSAHGSGSHATPAVGAAPVAGRAGPGDVDRSPAPRLAARRDAGRRRRRRRGRGADVAAGAPARRCRPCGS